MEYSFLIIDDNNSSITELTGLLQNFPNYNCIGIIKDNENVVNQIAQLKPHLVFVKIPFLKSKDGLTFKRISTIYKHMENIPYFIALSQYDRYAIEAIQAGISDYIFDPLTIIKLRKSLFKFEKRYNPVIPKMICLKSYSDYQFVTLEDIIFLQADNNTTDIRLANGRIVNAYKTLKHFEKTLPYYFMRIHKSYIVNIHHVTRIYFAKSKCYVNHYDDTLTFSLTYRKNIDILLKKINP